MNRLLAASTLLLLSGLNSAAGTDGNIAEQFPAKVRDTEGKAIDVARLAREKKVVVVTLKATWCPVCQAQLQRLKDKLNHLDRNRVTFLVLSPGPEEDLKAIKTRIGFPYPFIEDKGLRIARSLHLDMSAEEIFPAIFILDRNLHIRWMQRGRNGDYFGDEELLREIGIVEWI